MIQHIRMGIDQVIEQGKQNQVAAQYNDRCCVSPHEQEGLEVIRQLGSNVDFVGSAI